MPIDKAPGPDGFNGLFMKRCWSIISSDFIQLVNEFHAGTALLENLNEAFITLIPKKQTLNQEQFRIVLLGLLSIFTNATIPRSQSYCSSLTLKKLLTLSSMRQF